ncbi:MAG: DUF4340 domain-containing protein [Alphaproteobacteria bacterium]|nr:DUF4340 domain-containing protein [Alphaproteobacteria bacterium]MCB9793498.1 DUF4340 domain-containing protein [Alphaproteobacteria bacterium]
MKAFRGTLIAAALLVVALILVRVFDKPPEDTKTTQADERPIFVFEKQDLTRAEVKRPDGVEIALKETEDGWIIEESGFPASRTMVNRVKHQLHDLVARAKVIDAPEDMSLYGLGPTQAIEVTLTLRDGRSIRFKAGDPNPSGVSYYIQPLPGDVIYTVKKSAVDYYSLDLEEFRERRFASFDSKDADSIEADLPGGGRLHLQRVDDEAWEMLEPEAMLVSRDKARGLLGRISVLKAQDFVQDFDAGSAVVDLSPYGLDTPRARVKISFGSREPLTLLLGDVLPKEDPNDDTHAYMLVEGEGNIYTARDAFLEDFIEEPASFRLKRFVRLSGTDIAAIQGEIRRPVEPGDELLGVVTLRMVGDTWQWDDGLPVPGSTPRRLAMRIGGVQAEEFVDDAPADLAPYGLAEPVAVLSVSTEDGAEARTLLIGDEGPSRVGFEDHTIRRRYMKLASEAPVYLVDVGVLEVLEDALREQGRKAKKDEEKAERLERIEDAQGGEPQGDPE